jgi:hypothetical protein|tara:strand:+ start:578 stop:1270 length:693 start_codon:yes stop_codon:yes gene_type:complete
MSFTYAELKTAIQQYADNTETTFVANLPTFIKTVEERILKSVDLETFRKNVTGTLQANSQFLAVPSDYLASFSLSTQFDGTISGVSITPKTFLLQKDVNFIQTYTPAPQDTTASLLQVGRPLYYAYFDQDNFIIAPVPDDKYKMELHYFYRPQSLTAVGDNNTTWLSENAPNAMLFGSLVEATVYMKGEPDIMQMYNERFSESIARLKDYAEARENSDAYRRGLPERRRS